MTMATEDDDEFGDEIDWSSVPLHSISASSTTVPRPIDVAAANNINNTRTMTTGIVGAPLHHSSYYASAAVGSGVAVANTNATSAYNHSGYPPPHNNGANNMDDQNRSGATVEVVGSTAGAAAAAAAAAASNVLSWANNDVDALRKQIQNLQNQVQSKDDEIFELEASAATSYAESTHRTQQAETHASKRIHLVEEELRRTRMETEKYKGSWIRQKKRVAELESESGGAAAADRQSRSSNANKNGGVVRNSHHGGNHASAEDGRMGANNNLSMWGGGGRGVGAGIPADVELRKVTPSISNEEHDMNKDHHHHHSSMMMAEDRAGDVHLDESPTKISGSKRKKTRQISNSLVDTRDAAKNYLHQQVINSCIANSRVGDSVKQRLARHLLNREEMGCYSPHGYDYCNADMRLSSSMFSSESDLATDMNVDDEVTKKKSMEGEHEKESTERCFPNMSRKEVMRQDALIANETRAFVKSILFQMTESQESSGLDVPPASNHLSVSGLVHILLLRFNSLFHRLTIKKDDSTALDEDGDHVMENECEPNHLVDQSSSLGKSKIGYQRMALKLPNTTLSNPSGIVTCATVSWRAALYLLHVLHDILVLSGNARDDLRWWFYQARQASGNDGSSSNASSPNNTQHVAKEAKDSSNGTHPRIEGLPSVQRSGRWNDSDRKEVLWTSSCRSSCRGQESDAWDPITMAQPCNAFFEVLVGLMKGNVFEHSKNATAKGEDLPNFGLEQALVQLVQVKAIDLVLALMSDAPPYDHAKDSHRNRTPYLWKFWFDSLLPSYGSSRKPSSSDNLPIIGDFLSPWETRDSLCNNCSLGSGRKHSTRLLEDTTSDVMQQIKRGGEKQGRVGNRTSRDNSTLESSKESNTKSNFSLFHDVEKLQVGRLPILVNGRILQLLSHFVLSSSSVYQSLYHTVDGGTKSSLAKRILAAVLDYMEEAIVPFLSAGSSSKFDVHDAEQYLQLCFSCMQFLLIMSRSNEGIRLLRLQMRLESEQDEPSRWSQSAIGCVTSVLDSTLSFAKAVEEKKYVLKSTNLACVLNSVVDQCVAFFKTLLLFVEEQRGSSSKAATLLALISEHRTNFQSCCQRILAHQSLNSITNPPRLLHFSEGLKYDVRDLFEELVIDAEKENGDSR